MKVVVKRKYDSQVVFEGETDSISKIKEVLMSCHLDEESDVTFPDTRKVILDFSSDELVEATIYDDFIE